MWPNTVEFIFRGLQRGVALCGPTRIGGGNTPDRIQRLRVRDEIDSN